MRPTHSRASQSSGGAAAAAGGSLSTEELALREQNLLRREKALAEKEKFLEEKEASLAGARVLKPYNWPSKCYPILYHSISEEIPPEHRPMIRKFYATCLATWLCLFWNWLVMMVIWGTPGANDDSGSSDALWSSIYLVVGAPGAWRLWYRGLYFGVRDKASGKWVTFFITFLLHLVFCGCMAIGVPSIAASGLFIMFKMFSNEHSLAGIFSLVSVVIFGLNTLFSFYLLKSAHGVWKGTGGDKQLQKNVAKQVIESQASQV